MSVIKISAKGIDEINSVYKKLKKEYIPLGTIKLNSQSLEYELELVKNELEGALKSLCDKVIDIDELVEESSIFENFSFETLNNQLHIDPAPISLRGLQKVWPGLSLDKQRACFQYLCEQKELDIEKELVD